MYILLVEENIHDYIEIRRQLDKQAESARIEWVSDYEQAAKRMKRYHYDAYLIGYHVQQAEQQEFLAWLYQHAVTPTILLGKGNETVNPAFLNKIGYIDKAQFSWVLLKQMVCHLTHFIVWQQQEKKFHLIFDQAFEFISLIKPDGTLLEINQTALTFFGVARHQVIGQLIWETPWANASLLTQAQLKSACQQGRFVHEEMQVQGHNGQKVTLDFSITPLPNTPPNITWLLIEGRDLSRRQSVEKQSLYTHAHDQLTGLPNRHLFLEYLERAITQLQHHKNYHIAVLLIDLDRFKVINDSLGHDMGDWLLMEIAQRLLGCLKPNSILARSGGDEFMVLLDNLHDLSEATRLATTINEILAAPFSLEGYEIVTSASIGIAYSTHQTNRDQMDLLRDADAAMYHAKAQGKSRYVIFDRGMYTQAVSRLQLEMDLYKAVQKQNFVLFYQPQIALASGKLTGAESLIRLHHPTQGFLSPVQFLHILEDTGIITTVGEWILQEACYQLKSWLTQGLGLQHIAVNISAHQLRNKRLISIVADCIKAAHLPPECLELELTESALLEDIHSAVRTLETFKEMGIQVVLDDFGTGYASLSYLRRLPVDCLKIDKFFVQGLMSTPKDAAIVVATIDMAHALGLKVIAEGIETVEQRDFLRDHGCDDVQGYLYAAPLQATAFLKWAEHYNALLNKRIT